MKKSDDFRWLDNLRNLFKVIELSLKEVGNDPTPAHRRKQKYLENQGKKSD